MRRAVLLLAIGITLLAPWGEGGRAPQLLVALHTLAILAMLAACLAGTDGGGARIEPGLPRRLAALAIGWLLLAAASSTRASYPLAGALGFWDLAVCAGLFLTILATPLDAFDLRRLSTAVALSTSVQAVIALAHRPSGVLAAARIFLNPDHLAAFLNLGLLVTAGRAADRLEGGRRRAAGFWAGVSGLHAAAVLSLQSRGAFLGLFCGLLFLLAPRQRAWTPRARLVAAAALALSLFAGIGLLMARFTRVEDPYRYSRVGIWKAALGMIAERPFLGYGPGMFRHEGPRHNFPTEVGPFRFGKLFEGGHSALLTMAAEEGVPAASCLLAGIALFMSALLRARGPAEGDAPRTLGAALAALLIQGLVEDLQERPALMLVPALLAGFAVRHLRRPAPAEVEAGSRADARMAAGPRGAVSSFLPRRIAILLALYLFCLAVLLPYAADREAQAARAAGPAGLPRMRLAADLDPLQPEYRHDLAMAILNSGPLSPEHYAQAAAFLLEARRLKPIDSRFPLLLGRLEAFAGRAVFRDPSASGRAVGFYREAAEMAPCDPRPLLELAGYLADQKRDPDALEAVEKALRLEPRFVRARILEASILLRLDRRVQARAAFRSLEETRTALSGYRPDSGYAQDLMMDAPAERERLTAAIAAAGDGARAPGSL